MTALLIAYIFCEGMDPGVMDGTEVGAPLASDKLLKCLNVSQMDSTKVPSILTSSMSVTLS